VAFAVFVGTALVVGTSETARADSPVVVGAALGVCAGLLGVVLGALAITTAFITQAFVALVGDLRRALLPFTTIAVVAAAGLVVSLAALLGAGPAWWGLRTALVAFSLALTAWTVVGTVQLVQHVVYFASIRGREITTLLEAERIRADRLRQASGG